MEHLLETTILDLLVKNPQQRIQHLRDMHLRTKGSRWERRASTKPVNHLGRGRAIDFLERWEREVIVGLAGENM